MRIEHSNPTPQMWGIGLLFILVSSFIIIPSLQEEKLQTNWEVTFAEAGEVFGTGQAIDLHFFLEDEQGKAIEDAKVKAIFDRTETVHHMEKDFFRVQDGLYGTEVVFSVPGTWIIMLEIERGSVYYRNQFLVHVNGSIVSEESRDPADHFHLDQPLPNDLERELNRFSTFKR